MHLRSCEQKEKSNYCYSTNARISTGATVHVRGAAFTPISKKEEGLRSQEEEEEGGEAWEEEEEEQHMD